MATHPKRSGRRSTHRGMGYERALQQLAYSASQQSTAYRAGKRRLVADGNGADNQSNIPDLTEGSMGNRSTGVRGHGSRNVVLRDERICFAGNVGAQAHRDFMLCLYDARRAGHDEVVLDFSECATAFLDGMIPILAHVDEARRAGVAVSARMPEDWRMARLFLSSNWAHLLDPGQFESTNVINARRIAARRFETPEEQKAVVDGIVDIVMSSVALERDVIAGLEWSINEIVDNVLNHAECPEGGIVQAHTFSNNVAFTVADSGRGIMASLREGHPHVRTDDEAISEAMRAGVTRNAEAGQGNGIAGAMRIALMSGGSFEITSGCAQVAARVRSSGEWESEPVVYRRQEAQRFPGTLVSAQIGFETSFRLSEALRFSGVPHQPTDRIELYYETDDGSAVMLRLNEESTGFGSRHAGRLLRTKCANLMRAEPRKPLLLDWAGVRLVSSSFADELVGKLFVALGPLAFSARVRNVGMAVTVQSLIEKAIMERAAQEVSRAGSVDR